MTTRTLVVITALTTVLLLQPSRPQVYPYRSENQGFAPASPESHFGGEDPFQRAPGRPGRPASPSRAGHETPPCDQGGDSPLESSRAAPRGKPRGIFAARRGVSDESLRSLASTVRGYVERDEIIGAELLVIKNRRTILHEAFGWRDREQKIPMERNTIFNVRSMTKPLTGMAAQMLIDAGRLRLDDRVSTYLESFANDKCREITVEQLLTHRSGLPLMIPIEEGAGQTPTTILKKYKRHPKRGQIMGRIPHPALVSLLRCCYHNPVNIKDILTKIGATEAPLARQLLMTGLITRQLEERGKPAPVLIGGLALSYYTREVYFTADIDLAYADCDTLDAVLRELGFVKMGRYWVHAGLDMAVEVPASGLAGEEAPCETVELDGGLSCVVIGLEDLIIDRLNACKHWKSEVDCEMTELLIARYENEIDWAYLENKASLPENDTLAELRAFKGKGDL